MQASGSPSSRGQIVVWASLILLFLANLGVNWPLTFSFINFGFRDQGSFITLDALLQKHLKLAVDVGYLYGLFPVLLQHILSFFFGRGYWISLGCGLVYLGAMAFFWTLAWRQLGASVEFWIVLALLAPLEVMVMPVPAHAMLQLSVMFALLSVLQDKLPVAFAVAGLGWLSMPSLPIAASVLLFGWIVIKWAMEPERSAVVLLRKLLPGAATLIGGSLVLGAYFGWDSLRATVLPFAGAASYKARKIGIFGDGWYYLHPPGARIGYYLGTKVGWWIAGTLLLTILAAHTAILAWAQRKLSARGTFILFCWTLHFIFIFIAFGTGYHTMYYDPMIVAGVLAGLLAVPNQLVRRAILIGFVGLGILGQTTTIRALRAEWKNSQRFQSTGALYAPRAFELEWKPILDRAAQQKVLILSYGNGITEFFPEVQAPDSWFLLPGLLKENEKKRLIEQMQEADTVAEELGGDTVYIDQDEEIQRALKRFPKVESGKCFRVWRW